MHDPFYVFDYCFDDDEIEESLLDSLNQSKKSKQPIQSPQKNVFSDSLSNKSMNFKDGISIAIQNFLKNSSSNKKDKNKNKRKRVPFLPEEDEKLKMLVQKFGTKKWLVISNYMNGRSAKQCRDRYMNHLFPGYFNCEWSKEEVNLLFNLYYQVGPKWPYLKKFFIGRSANSLKNRWTYFLAHQENKTYIFLIKF